MSEVIDQACKVSTCDIKDPVTSDLKNARFKGAKNGIIGHLNINSIRYKFDNIADLLKDNLVDIFSITETKLDDSFTHAQFSYMGYKVHRKDRTSSGGGIMTYVRSDIPHRTRPDLECQTQHVE